MGRRQGLDRAPAAGPDRERPLGFDGLGPSVVDGRPDSGLIALEGHSADTVEFAGPDLAPGDVAGLEMVAADDG
jgi:hypothetical protein